MTMPDNCGECIHFDLEGQEFNAQYIAFVWGKCSHFGLVTTSSHNAEGCDEYLHVEDAKRRNEKMMNCLAKKQKSHPAYHVWWKNSYKGEPDKPWYDDYNQMKEDMARIRDEIKEVTGLRPLTPPLAPLHPSWGPDWSKPPYLHLPLEHCAPMWELLIVSTYYERETEPQTRVEMEYIRSRMRCRMKQVRDVIFRDFEKLIFGEYFMNELTYDLAPIRLLPNVVNSTEMWQTLTRARQGHNVFSSLENSPYIEMQFPDYDRTRDITMVNILLHVFPEEKGFATVLRMLHDNPSGTLTLRYPKKDA